MFFKIGRHVIAMNFKINRQKYYFCNVKESIKINVFIVQQYSLNWGENGF